MAEQSEGIPSERWVAVRLYGKHVEPDSAALSGYRAQSGTLLRGDEQGEASCRLVGDADPKEVMDDGPEEHLYLLRVSEIRKYGMDVVRTPKKGGPGHCDIVDTRLAKSPARRKLLNSCLWVNGYAPEGVSEKFLADMVLGQTQPVVTVQPCE